MTECMRFHSTLRTPHLVPAGRTKRGHHVYRENWKMRPGTPIASMHWTSMFYENYKDYDGLQLVYTENGTPEIWMSKEFKDQNENAFKHLMTFCRIHEVSWTVDKSECEKCSGHGSCLVSFEWGQTPVPTLLTEFEWE